ncbi:MAG: aspartate/glutamate racemase family protein [Candidatus Methanomethylicaceae archaeon]
MRIIVINLNTSREISHKIYEAVLRVKRPDAQVDVVQPRKGPAAIESSYDEAFAVPPMLELVKKANASGYDAIVLGCFCDAGVEAAREISEIPVIAMEEASLALALTLGSKFGIITERRHRVAMKELHVRRAGLLSRLASIRPSDLSVTELAHNPERAKKLMLALAREMVEDDGAEVIIMGCAAMAGYGKDIEKELSIPVIDPVVVAYKFAEMLVDLGLRHSKVGLYHSPTPKD